MAANRICKVLKVNQDNERLMEEYERLASDVSTVLLIKIWCFGIIFKPRPNIGKSDFPPAYRNLTQISFLFNSYLNGFAVHFRGWRVDNQEIPW